VARLRLCAQVRFILRSDAGGVPPLIAARGMGCLGFSGSGALSAGRFAGRRALCLAARNCLLAHGEVPIPREGAVTILPGR